MSQTLVNMRAIQSSASSTITATQCLNTGDDLGGVNSTAKMLFGREEETEKLLNVYQDMALGRGSKIVTLHGTSGSGKTSLLDTMREPVSNSQGYFCAGKFFQDKSTQEPYSAIMAAFSDLCELVNQDDDFMDRRPHIQKALGADGHLLLKTISSLALFVDIAHEDIDVKIGYAFTKFKVACRTFLHAMSSPEHPIVLVLDDIQWMDKGSKQAIEVLLQESKQLEHVMFVLVYRDDEEVSQISDVLKLVNADDQSTEDISLKLLDHDAVHGLICDILDTAPEDIDRDLSELVLSRTEGNPFHVLNFIEFLEQDSLLQYGVAGNGWKYNVEAIRRGTMLSESIASVLVRKIERLPSHVQTTLRVASLVGCQFRELVVSDVMRNLDNEKIIQVDTSEGPTSLNFETVGISLRVALKERIVERTSTGYQFTHDKILSSFRDMVDEVEGQRLHKVIGETFLTYGDAESNYHSAIHLNRANIQVLDHQERSKMARVNSLGATYCKEKSAFILALDLLNRGLQYLPQNWDTNYKLRLNMMQMLSKMQLVIGSFDECKATLNTVIIHARSVNDKVDSMMTSFDVWFAETDMRECIRGSTKFLRELGIRMPSRVTVFHLIAKLMKLRRLLHGKTDADILGLPTMTDNVKVCACKLLSMMAGVCVVENEEQQGAYCSLLAMELTLIHGLSAYSAGSFSSYAIFQYALGQIDSSVRFKNLAFTFLDSAGARRAQAYIFPGNMALLVHLSEPIKELSGPADSAIDLLLARGEVTPAIVFGPWIRLCAGENLAELEKSSRSLISQLSDLGQDAIILWMKPILQFALNLRQEDAASWHELTELTGEVMTESSFVEDAHPAIMVTMLMIKSQLAIHFGYWSLAESVLRELLAIAGKNFQVHFAYVFVHFFAGLACYERHHEQGKRKWLRLARKSKRSIDRLESLQCPNAIPFARFLDAEDSKYNKADNSCLEESYNVAIEAMSEAELTQLEALANERAGFSFVERGNLELAEAYFCRAKDLYRDKWGAPAKVDWIEARSGRLLRDLRLAHLREQQSAATTPSAPTTIVGSVIQVSHGTNDDSKAT